MEYRTVIIYGEHSVRDQVDFTCSLYGRILELLPHGAREFLFLKDDEFDRLAAKVIRNLKKTYPIISSVLVMTPSPRAVSTHCYDKVLLLPEGKSKEESVIEHIDAVITDTKNPYESTNPFFRYTKEKQFFFLL